MSNRTRPDGSVGPTVRTKSDGSTSALVVASREKDRSKGQIGVRYITEDLIKKLSGQEHLEITTTLNLNLAKEGGKIKYIENLEKLKKLKVLNLSNNAIEKIEKLDKLTNLQELNLSYNFLTKIENLEPLSGLQVLNLTGNQIQHVPLWLTKKLKGLRVLGLAKNHLESIDEISKLQSLSNLVQLSVAGNPISELPHCRLLIVFHLRTLQMLDGQEITSKERKDADQRFAQEEVDRLRRELEMLQQEKCQLAEEHNLSVENEGELVRRQQAMEQERQVLEQELKERKQELLTTVQLLQKKTSDLTRTSMKQYQLEQELAFYKIDHKFDALSHPQPDTPESMSMEEGSAGESPYIGKGRFRPNEMAHEAFINARPIVARQGQVNNWPKGGGATSGQAPVEGRHVEGFAGLTTEQTKAIELMNQELEDKQKAIRSAENQLQRLRLELDRTERDLGQASKEQQRLKTTENGKQTIRENLIEKSKNVSRLQKEAESIDAAMRVAREEIFDKESELKQFYSHLKQMNTTDDPNYSSFENEAGSREEHLNQAQLRYKHLQKQLEQRLAAMKQEAEDIKHMEQELRSNHVGQNEELKQELESIVRGLGSYLHGVRQTADAQNLELSGLMRDRSELVQKLRDLEKERQVILRKANRETAYLKQQLADMEESLRERQSLNESLKQQLNESQTRDVTDSVEDRGRLQEANAMIEGLKRTIAALQTEKQTEKETLEKQLQSDGKRMGQMRLKIREADMKDSENRNLHRQLTELQTANARLQDQLYAAQEKLRQQKQTSVDPEALRRRLEEVTKAIKASKGMGQNEKVPSRKTDDPLEQVIGALEENVHREMEKKSTELDKAQRAKERMESKLLELRDEITQVQELERSRAEQAIQTVVNNERRDQENLLAEIQLLQDELARERANRERQSTDLLRERKATGQSTATSGSGSGSSTGTTETGSSSTGKTSSAATTGSSSSSSTSSSVWSVKKREIYNTMTNDEKALFDELQKEIEELRNLLAANDTRASSKAEAAREKTDRLKDMIDQRYVSVGMSAAGSYSNSARQSSASSVTSESEDLQKALYELDDVQAKVEACREKLIKESRERNRLHASNQGDRSQLYEILDDQRKEIDHLSRALDDEIRHKNYMAQQHSTASHPMVSNVPPHLLHNISQPALDTRPSKPLQPVHFLSSFNPYPHLEPQGTNASPIQHAVNSGIGPNGGYGGVYPSFVHPHQYPPTSSDPGPIQYPLQSSFAPYPSTGSAFANSGHPLVSTGQAGIPAGHQRIDNGPPEYGQGVGIQPQNLAPTGFGQLFPHGFTPNQPLQQGTVAMPMQGVGYLTGQPVLAPTTPVAGSGFAQPYMKAPGATTGQPLMMSTPSAIPNTASPKRKNFLTSSDRNGGAGEEHVGSLFCNVPEHHDLEDHISKLQHKNRSLQIRLRDEAEDLSFREKESRHVAFEDDSRVSRAAVLRLESELEKRRIEIEGLDLAVERQKTFFKNLREEENSILAKREAIKKEFESLQRGRVERRNFQSFLESTSPIRSVPGYDYDFDMKQFGSQKEYLVSELKCAEKTLSARRSELAEIEHHIAQCKADFIDAQNELKTVKSELHSTVETQKDVERCTHNTGVLLLDAESKVRDTHLEVERLEEQKNQLKAIVKDIEDVIRAKDEEFQILEMKIEQATHCLETLQKDFADDSNISVTKEQEVLELMNQEIVARQQDLEALLIEIKTQRSLLGLVNSQVEGDRESKRKEIQMIDRQLETLRSEKRHLSDEIKTNESRLQSICVELNRGQMTLKRLLSSKSEQNTERLDIEDQLRCLRSDVAESQLTLHEAKEQLRHRGVELEDVESQLEDKQTEVKRLVSKQEELSNESERLRSENQKIASELERLRQLMDREKKEYETFEADRRNFENGVTRLKWEKESLEEEEKKLSAHITDLNKVHEEMQRAVHDQQQKLMRLNKELMKVEEAFDGAKHEHSILNGELHGLRSQIEGGQSELMEVKNDLRNTKDCVKGLSEERDELLRNREELETDVRRLNVKVEELKQAVQEKTYELGRVTANIQGQTCQLEQSRVEIQSLKQEAERRHINEAGFLSLEDRIKNLGKEISRRDNEIEQQRIALMQAKQDHEHKQKLLAAEMEALREKSSNRISDLEAAARAQYARANRLVDEMSYQRAEYLELKRQLDTRKELAEREANLVDALTSLKSDLQLGVTENILDLERARKTMVAEEERSLNKTKENLEYYINNLRESLNLQVIRAQNSSSVAKSNGENSLSELDVLKAKQDSIKKANLGNIEQLKKQSCNEKKLTELERIMQQAEEISRQTDTAKLAQLQATRTTSTDAPDSHPSDGSHQDKST